MRKPVSLFLAAAIPAALFLLEASSQADINLVPIQPATAPNYFCTWSAQNYMYGQGLPSMDPAILEGGSGSNLAWLSLTEKVVFGPQGWANTFYPRVRKDLYFLLDDGYYTGDAASMELNPQKFPSFPGDPGQRLKAVRLKLEAAGWRGLGLWTRHTPNTPDKIEPLLQRSLFAGVKYWKIDGGDGDFSVQALKQKDDPSLVLEHVSGEGPFNGDWSKDGRFGPQTWGVGRLNILKQTDVFRTYDVSTLLSVPTTLDRVAQLLNGAQGHPEAAGLLNCEDEVYLAATLGCTMGVMRHPLVGLRPSGDPDVCFAGPRQTKRRMDEVVRALHWQRIAAPYGVGQGYVKLDKNTLADNWVFKRGETWDTEVIGHAVNQGAPARVSRNLPLPIVTAPGELPFVVTARFPNGAAAVCTLERNRRDKAWFMPLAAVTVETAGAPGPFGIFGHYKTLTLHLPQPLAGKYVFAQDLAGEKAVDVTKRVHIQGNLLTIPGALIDKIGCQNAAPGDLSDPGLVLAIRDK